MEECRLLPPDAAGAMPPLCRHAAADNAAAARMAMHRCTGTMNRASNKYCIRCNLHWTDCKHSVAEVTEGSADQGASSSMSEAPRPALPAPRSPPGRTGRPSTAGSQGPSAPRTRSPPLSRAPPCAHRSGRTRAPEAGLTEQVACYRGQPAAVGPCTGQLPASNACSAREAQPMLASLPELSVSIMPCQKTQKIFSIVLHLVSFISSTRKLTPPGR